MSNPSALHVLREAASSMARGGDLETTLLGMLRPLADQSGIASAAVFTRLEPSDELEIAAAIGLGDPAALAAAVRHPVHPVARTVTERASTFDVRPMAAGGPALRSHLPLIVGSGVDAVVVGVLALAHDQPMDDEARAIVETVADLVAVAVARGRANSRER